MTSSLFSQLTNQLKQTSHITGLILQFQRCMATKRKIPYRLEIQGLDPNKYTHVAIPFPKTGGRGVDGKVENKRVSGGSKQKYRMIDKTRPAPSTGEPVVEKVLQVRSDPLRSAHIALVGKENEKRWIICTDGVKKGDLIQSYGHIPTQTVLAKKGDSYRLGALPLGAVIHHVEKVPDEGAKIALSAGTCAVIARKTGKSCIVKMPSGHEVILDEKCIAVFGSVSNPGQNLWPIGSPNRMRWLGIKQRSGLRHRKVGYNGQKMKKGKSAITYEKSAKSTHEMFDAQ